MLKSACNCASWIQGELCEGKTDIITPDKDWVESPANTETGRSHVICDLNVMNIFREMNEDYITQSNISAQKNNFCCKFKAPKMRIVDEEDFFHFLDYSFLIGKVEVVITVVGKWFGWCWSS